MTTKTSGTWNQSTFHVEVREVRTAYGRVDYLVVPEAGEGSTWVSAERVHLDEATC